MPTYLVAIIVSNFVPVSAPGDIFNKPVKVYGEPRYIAPDGDTLAGGGNDAALTAALSLAYMQKTYKFPYEMPKMDLAAIPAASYAADTTAMENWGLNTFKDTFLYLFEGEQSWDDRSQVFRTIAHEEAHQWFGNLVTCRDWENLWLNEGFASYLGSVVLQAIYPEWDDERWALWLNVQYALDADVVNEFPLLSDGFKSPFQIPYNKGASIVRMMEGFLGKHTLTKALIKYLKKYAYKSVVQDQLFEQLTIQAEIDYKLPKRTTIKDIMDTWTLQPGFPLIRVVVDGYSHILVSEERFKPVGEAGEGVSDQVYFVPIATAVEGGNLFSNHTPRTWLYDGYTSARIPHDTDKWIIINPDGMGYYRVIYDDTLLDLILAQLKVDRYAISGLSRSTLIDDYFVFAENGLIDITKALEVTLWIQNDVDIEVDFIVWYPLLTRLKYPRTMFISFTGGTDHSLAIYLLPKIEAALDSLGWIPLPSDKGIRVVFGVKLLEWAVILGSSAADKLALDYIKTWMKIPSSNPIPLDVRPWLYAAAIRAGETEIFDFFLEQYEASPIGAFKSHKQIILKALAFVQKIEDLQRLLGQTVDTSSAIGSIPKDAATLIKEVAANPVGQTILLDFLREHFTFLVENLGGSSFIAEVLTALAAVFNKDAELEALRAFIKQFQTELSAEQESLDTAVETVEKNIAWIAKNYEVMNQWFLAY